MAKKSFFKGAVILGIAGIIVKVFGAFFRIPLANIIGDTGMGYYQTAYPVYVLLLTLSTAGIPTAIARLVSERTTEGNHKEAYRIFTVSFRLLLAMGIVTSLLLFLGAPYIVQYMKGEPEAIYSMRSIAPALLFVPIMAAFRGYFQGQQDMTPTASSQVIEQAFRVVFGLSMAVILLPAGLKFAAAGASAGAAARRILRAYRYLRHLYAEAECDPGELQEFSGRRVGSCKEYSLEDRCHRCTGYHRCGDHADYDEYRSGYRREKTGTERLFQCGS